MKRKIICFLVIVLVFVVGIMGADHIQKIQSKDALRIVLDESKTYEIAVGDGSYDFTERILESVGERTITLLQGDVNVVGSLSVAYVVQDRYGQQKKEKTMFEVVDRTAPVITVKQELLVLEHDADVKAAMRGNIVQIVDNYDKGPIVEVHYESGANQGEYRARDAFGNESVRVVSISIKASPVLKVPTVTPAKLQPTYLNTILLVNKTYAIPQDYVSPQKGEAYARLQEMLAAAVQAGHPIALLSGYRSYQQQATLFQKYVNTHGLANAQMFSARPAHSEHQSGLGYDIGSISNDFANTPAYAWLQENAASYGFIERYPNGKTHITGYVFEPWHYRYVGVLHAQTIKTKGLTLEEYVGAV